MSQASDAQSSAGGPEIVEFGPYRAIGVRMVTKGGPECGAVWGGPQGVMARMGEIKPAPGGPPMFFGLCRCVPGVTDGSFEYIAAVSAAPDAAAPEGMVEAPIAAGSYAVFPVAGLAEIGTAWGAAHAWLAAHPEWEGFCGPRGCDCAEHPAFELYPPGFPANERLLVYLPVRRKV